MKSAKHSPAGQIYPGQIYLARGVIAALVTFTLLAVLAVANTAQAQRRGLISSAPCPYSCATRGIPKSKCRDWKEGGRCFTEDLRKRPTKPKKDGGSRRPWNSASPNWTATAQWTPTPHWTPVPTPSATPYYPRPTGVSCSQLRRQDVSPPRVDIHRVYKTGNFFKAKYRVRGTIEGACLAEAGRFEFGRQEEEIYVPETPRFGRYEFSVTVNASKRPEIRVYNIFGDRAQQIIDPANYDRDGYSNGVQQRPGNFGNWSGGQNTNTRPNTRPTLWPFKSQGGQEQGNGQKDGGSLESEIFP